MADDLKAHVHSSEDFYDLLGVNESAQEPEIRRAYRKTALKYHPDKVGASDTQALDKFHLLQIAHDVLSDPTIKELYDNARRAKQAKAERDQAFEGRRKWMKEDLEKRERDAMKRKRGENDAGDAYQREIDRLAANGRRRRQELAEKRRKEALDLEETGDDVVLPSTIPGSTSSNLGSVPEAARSVTVTINCSMNGDEVASRFERFGAVEGASVREKKVKLDGEKHRRKYSVATILFTSVVGAHAAVLDFAKVSLSDERLKPFETLDWATGRQPDCVPTVKLPAKNAHEQDSEASPTLEEEAVLSDDAQKKARANGIPSAQEILSMRLKNAQKRRVEQKIRKQEAETA